MKKFLISMLALFFVFATVHAQTDSSSSMSAGTHKMKSKSSSGMSTTGHHKMHHKGTTAKHKMKSKTTTGGAQTGTSQKPVAATSTPSTSTAATAKITKAKGAHYAVNSNGKKAS